MDSDEPVVGNSEVKKLEDRVRELERMLGRKTMEVEILREALSIRPNQVGAMDITYVPMARGFVYLCAVVDWFSRGGCRSRWKQPSASKQSRKR